MNIAISTELLERTIGYLYKQPDPEAEKIARELLEYVPMPSKEPANVVSFEERPKLQ